MNRRLSRILSRAALLSVPLVISTVFAAPAALAAPQPVSNVQLNTQDGYVYIDWAESPSTGSARACYLAGATPPASPTDPSATCSEILSAPGWTFQGVDGQSYGISVFAYDVAASEYSAPATATIIARDLPPSPPVQLRSAPTGVHDLYLWWEDNDANKDTKDYLVNWSPGLTVPPLPTATTAPNVVSWQNTFVNSLATGTVYTFAVWARDVGGHVGQPALLRAATRTSGLWLADNNRVGGAIKASTEGYYSTAPDASAMLQGDGFMRAAFIAGGLHVSNHTVDGGWNVPGTLSVGATGIRHPLIASAPRIIVTAWTQKSGVYYATKTTASWSKPVRVSSNAAEQVVGLASDRAHRIHLLVVRTAGTGRGLYYLVRSGGVTTRAFVAGSGPADIGLLTRDGTTDKVVVVDRHRGAITETVRVKVLAPSATRVGTMTTWLSSTNRAVQWRPTMVAANGGRISVGMQRVTSVGSKASDGPYVMYGTATLHRSAIRVRGTSAVDTNLTVSAPTPNKVILSWQRHNAGWDPGKLGIWQSTRTFNVAGYWTYSAPTHWSRSAYDVPVGAFADTAGHLYVVYVEIQGDVVP